MVALLGLFQAPEVVIEFLLREPGRAVNALQHGAILVTAPVRTGYAHQLERADLAGIFDMGAATQVQKGVLRVDADFFIRQVFDKLNLIGLPLVTEVLQGLLARPAIAYKWVLARDNTGHALLDIGQITGRQGTRQIEIIIKTVFDSRPNG